MVLFTRRFKHFLATFLQRPGNCREVTTHHKLSVSVSQGCVGANGVTDGSTGGPMSEGTRDQQGKQKMKEGEDKVRMKVIKKERNKEGRT